MKVRSFLLAGAAMFIATGAYAQSSSLVGLYTFDNAANLGRDSSGNNNNLLAYGSGATYTADGASGGGLLLDGNSYMSTASQMVPGLFPTGNSAYTLSVSFKTTSFGNDGLIGWGNYNTYNQVNALRTFGGVGLVNYWWFNDVAGNGVVSDGLFHTATASYDGTIRNLYLDGSLIGTDTPNSPDVGAANFAVGLTNAFNGEVNGNEEHFIGTLDNVAIFNTAQTPAQVAAAITAVSAVPEPASWAMMIVGAGLVGGTLRRRRKIETRVSYAA